MSWDVVDDAWLARPGTGPSSGPIDALDQRVLSSLWVTDPAAEHADAGAEPPGPALGDHEQDAAAAGVPPPPHSAAFDDHQQRPSWESGSYAADPEEQDPVVHPQQGLDEAPIESASNEAAADEAESFHIPALSLSAQPVAPASVSAPTSELPAGPEEAAFVIPNLSRPAAPPVVVPAREQHPVLESPVAAPVPTASDPAFASNPLEPAIEAAIEPAIEAANEPATEPAGPTDPIHGDPEHQPGTGAPEVLERVDSSELELLADDDEEEDLAATETSGPEAFAGFVIPMLARPVQSPQAPQAVPPAQSPTSQLLREPVAAGQRPEAPGGGLRPPVVGSGASAVVIPSLTRPEPVAPPPPRPPVTEVVASAESAAVERDEAERDEAERDEAERDEAESAEVESLEVENLDSADLEEVDHPAPAAEAEEVKPPTPPEAKPQPKRRKAWYDDVFAEHFLALFPSSWEETAARDAEFIHSQLGLPDGANVLDVGCGEGSHAVHLAKLGLRMTGLDNSLALLLAAAQNKELAGIEDDSVVFMHGDMRRLPRDREFDGVICVGSTFGYFEEEQNRLCLQEMYERLPVGGKLLLHVFNRDFVAPQLPSRSWWQGKRCMVIDEAEMNFFANRLRIHRTAIFDDGRQHEHYMFMRAYTVQDLGKAMSQIGLRVVEVSGSRDTRGRFYGSASPDIWMVAERK